MSILLNAQQILEHNEDLIAAVVENLQIGRLEVMARNQKGEDLVLFSVFRMRSGKSRPLRYSPYIDMCDQRVTLCLTNKRIASNIMPCYSQI